jgi:hypothetical protein
MERENVKAHLLQHRQGGGRALVYCEGLAPQQCNRVEGKALGVCPVNGAQQLERGLQSMLICSDSIQLALQPQRRQIRCRGQMAWLLCAYGGHARVCVCGVCGGVDVRDLSTAHAQPVNSRAS